MNSEDKLQKIDVPKAIKALSVIYIAICAIAGFAALLKSVLEQGHITLEHFQYAVNVLGKILVGFVFWGVGQVFSKFMEKR